MSFVLGLTGGIGMGKSTAAEMFRQMGHPVWDADDSVHRLYAAGGAAVAPVAAAFPDVAQAGAIDRTALRKALAADPGGFARLEEIVHPLVAEDRRDFLQRHHAAPIVVLDIPLLYEKGSEGAMDAVAVVSAPAELQRERVLARPGMTEDSFRMILSRQMPDAEKRKRADFIIPSVTRQGAQAAIMDICDRIMAGRPHA
ncbi:dephospho-CoA kinase [Paracoccus sp. NGMCC 1.201697]|uniref:Dephospho-CoA kinase n=1 Tax=Paracoccus broussonetiae subsp. drimophilus TaxID=3373869 RepID=A0ABW7LN25_9RHOB